MNREVDTAFASRSLEYDIQQTMMTGDKTYTGIYVEMIVGIGNS